MSTNALTTHAPAPMPESPLPREILSQLYSSMMKVRLLQQRIHTAPQTGEAILSGAIQNAEDGDVVVTSGLHPVVEILRGADTSTFLKPKLAGKKHPQTIDAIQKVVAAESAIAPSVAAGLALAMRRSQLQSVVLAFFPGKVTQGATWDQAAAFAASCRAPLVLIVDSTQSRKGVSHEGRDLSRWPMPTIAVDGRDVIAVYRVVKEAASCARKGHGPTLVDCTNFVVPGTRGRDSRDPLTTFQGYLQRHNAWSDDYLQLHDELKRSLGLNKGR